MSDLFDLPFDAEDEAPKEEPTSPVAGPDGTAPSETPHIYTVSELTAGIRALIEDAFPEVWVEGELSNCRTYASGHLYFTLKDGSAQLKGVMWKVSVRGLRFKPEDGLQVIARGSIGLYEPRGEYQLVCEHLEPRGLGALQLAFDQLKRKLQAEGLFDAARKRPLPLLPRTIGVVTSIDGAALRDILKVLGRRHPNLRVVIRPVRVQGEGAAADIARGLDAIGRVAGVDVVICGRGGGSTEDLWAFNEEDVARAIAASQVPVISAVGHETDVTIADLVADVRAPTPSAAAEIVVARKDEFTAAVERFADRARAAMGRRVDHARFGAERLASRTSVSQIRARLAMRGRDVAEFQHALRLAASQRRTIAARRFDGLRARLDAQNLRRRVAMMSARLVAARTALKSGTAEVYHRSEGALSGLAGKLDSLSPLAVLARGYAVCWNAERTSVLRTATDVRAGERVRVTLGSGELGCTVNESVPPGTPGLDTRPDQPTPR